MINKGGLVLIEEKAVLMSKLGQKKLTLDLVTPVTALPKALAKYNLEIRSGGKTLQYNYDTKQGTSGIAGLLKDLAAAKLEYSDLHTEQSSLEDIFMGLVTQ